MNPAAWQGAPGDILGGPVPVQQFVARTEHAVIALQQIVAFPQGCSLALHIAVRRGAQGERAWERLCQRSAGDDPGVAPGGAGLRLGVRFPGGSTATTVSNAFPGWTHPTGRPEPPLLVEDGGGTTSSDRFCQSDRRLWLCPLPPPGPFEFVVEWQDLGIGVTALTLDGSVIGRAAEQARPYWP
jgi:hypothetical protein